MGHNPDPGNPERHNPDPGNPERQNPDTGNPERHNPDLGNPERKNPDPGNPERKNPDPGNPECHNPDPGNPERHNPDPGNPERHNPDPGNPERKNPKHPESRSRESRAPQSRSRESRAPQTLPYRCGEPLKTLPVMDLHRSRSLVRPRSCCVVTPPIASLSLSRYFSLGLPLLLLPAILPVRARFSRPSALIMWPRNSICRLLTTANNSLWVPIASSMLKLLRLCTQLTLNILLHHHTQTEKSTESAIAVSPC